MEFHLKNINPSDLDNNADSDLSTDIYYKISETLLQVAKITFGIFEFDEL